MAGNADEEADWIEFELDDMQVKDWLWTMPMRNGDSVEVVAEPTGKNHYVAYAVKRDGDDLLAVYPHATAGRKVHYRSFQGTSTYLKYGHYPTEQHKPFHLHENSKIMINLIRLGDDTDHGGKVITASSTMRFDGLFVARKGDEVSCPKHPSVKPNVIEEGNESLTDDGLPIARHGHRATCGCHLISSLV